MSVVIDASRASAPDRPGHDQSLVSIQNVDDLDPVVAAARAAGRLAGERLARTPLTPHQRAVVASLMGGAQ